MQTIQNKLRNHKYNNDYEPLRVDVRIIPPFYTTSPWIFFDGIVSYLCMRDVLGESFWSLPSDHVVNLENLDIPLEHTKDVYHASVGILDNPVLKKTTVFKRFTDYEVNTLDDSVNKGRLRTNSGYYKDAMINLPAVVTDNITFYCKGDKQELTRLLKHLQYVGKKTAYGGGEVKDISITSINEDYSFLKEGKVMRPIPVGVIDVPVVPGRSWRKCTYKSPYWDGSQSRMCVVPENQLV
jgi:CRISPR type IV-associated protein Csf3